MSAREDAVGLWDTYIRDWLNDRPQRPEPLERWRRGYKGPVTEEAMPEPYIGPWHDPRMIMLGLNPGQADLKFQGLEGTFAQEIDRLGSFQKWAATDPYGSDQWEAEHGVNIYRRARLAFARRWTDDPTVEGKDLLGVELYPWHSKNVTATMTPPAEVLDQFVWRPLAETGAPLIFAFGARWAKMCARLHLTQVEHWGRNGKDFGSAVASRTVLTYRLNDAQCVVVSWQLGYAGPPNADDVARLRDRLSCT